MRFNVQETEKFSTVKFELDGPISPETLENLKFPKVTPTKGVIISGRGPIWLYAALVHAYHATRWVATHDPRLGGGVVVTSHVPEIVPGMVIKMEA